MESSKRVKLASEEVIDRFLANVWQVIFEMLPVKDRIRLEMTNKRLRTLMCAYWKRVTSFDAKCITEMSDRRRSRRASRRKNRWEALVPICVNRIGDGLRSLTIREMCSPIAIWIDSLRSIGERCPNVETINFVFEDEDFEYPPFDIRFDSFSRLKKLTVSAAGGNFARASASVFLSIPTSIEVIRELWGRKEEPFENAAQMEGFFADRPSLREIYLCDLHTRDESNVDIFRVIAERCPHLKSIEIPYYYNKCIDYSGVVTLESMKDLRVPVNLDEVEIVTICERSPLVEALEFRWRFSSNLHLQSAALNALGMLTKLAELCLYIYSADEVAPWFVTEFVRELGRNSGASLRHLNLGSNMPLATAAIEALANGCAKLRYVQFHLRLGEATPASIRFLIDCIVADPSWIAQTSELDITICLIRDGVDDDEAEAGMDTFDALAAPAANLPAGVGLIMKWG